MLHPQTPTVMEANELNKEPIEGTNVNADVNSNDPKDLSHKLNVPELPMEESEAYPEDHDIPDQDNVAGDEVDDTPQKTVTEDYSTFGRAELTKALRTLIRENQAASIRDEVETIKQHFDKATAELDEEAKAKFVESGEPVELYVSQPDQLQKEFSTLLFEYRNKRDEERQSLEQIKERNLAAKYEVIEGIKDLINRQESLHHTFDEFRALQQKWREIGPVPQNEVHDLWETYHLHVENFYNYIKINKELRDLDLKKNYEAKLELCEKAERLLLEPSIIKAFKTLQRYHEQWREIGPVPKDKKEELWERFRNATMKINQKHQEYFEQQREQQQKNLEAKQALCEKVEAILQQDLKTHSDWVKNSKAIIDIQKVWKTIGFAPKKENQEIYLRFRKACDQFFELKRKFFKAFKEEQIQNLQLKTELLEKAEALKDSTD